MNDNPGIFLNAIGMIFSLNGPLWEIVSLSLTISLAALLLATFLGLPLGALLAITRFRGHGFLNILLNAFMGLPPVVAGLFVYMLLSRSGPLGLLGLLYTPSAMIIAQTILIFPIIAALSRQHIEDLNRHFDHQFSSWGLSLTQRIKTLLWECRLSLLTVLLAGFGRAIAEVGAVMIVGGNIEHMTRTMTTAIQMEISKGNLELAMALGLTLLFLSLSVNFIAYGIKTLARRGRGL